MRKFILVLILLTGVGLVMYITSLLPTPSSSPPKITPIPAPLPYKKEVDFKATFTIITNGITRSFIHSKYHNKSSDVYITADNPTIVHAKKEGITWQNFFDTLPMKLTKECLTTGDGEVLCDKKGGSLKFFLNGIEDKDLLDREIEPGQKALITYFT